MSPTSMNFSARRKQIFIGVGALLLLVVLWSNQSHIARLSQEGTTLLKGALHQDGKTESGDILDIKTPPLNVPSPLNREARAYFDQAFSLEEPATYPFHALSDKCRHTEWKQGEIYLECQGINAGLTSIMSEVKTCFKMALDAGIGILLPNIPLRDSTNLNDYNIQNISNYHVYDDWWDVDHLVNGMGRACPQMKFMNPKDLDKDSPTFNGQTIENKWTVDLAKSGWSLFTGFFWKGRPFKTFFDSQFETLTEGKPVEGLTTISIWSAFLAFRNTDDPTGEDLRLWNDLAHLIRFRQDVRSVVHSLLSHIDRPYYGVHFRVERDNMWSSEEHQLEVDLETLEKSWAKYGKAGEEKPLVYLACGDQGQIDKFRQAGAAKGWKVIGKWELAQNDPEVLDGINALAFDFQGAVDMGVMMLSHFFIGLQGSAFSSSIGNARDPTGKYRGSSFDVYDDKESRNHLFNDGDGSMYACCL